MSTKKKNITQKDIAQATGLSQVAVSLALRNQPTVAPATIKLVQEAARKLGYKPNVFSQTLRASREINDKTFNGVIGVLDYNPVSDVGTSTYFAFYYNGMKQRAEELGYKIEYMTLDTPNMTAKRMSHILESRSIKGIINLPLKEGRKLPNIQWENFFTVSIGLTIEEPSFHSVAVDHFQAITQCYHKLKERGVQKIGMVYSETMNRRLHGAFTGPFLNCIKNDLPQSHDLLLSLLFEKNYRKHYQEWIQSVKPDAILAAFYGGATLVKEWNKEIDRGLEKKIKIASFNVRSESDPSIPGIDQKFEVNGANAVNILVGMMHRNEPGIPKNPLKVLTRCEWVESINDIKEIANIKVPKQKRIE